MRFLSSLILSVPLVCYAENSQIDSEQYLGAGLSRINIKSGHPSIGSQSISGIAVVYGVRDRNHVFEVVTGGGGGLEVGPTYDIYYPEDKAGYAYFNIGYHYQFRDLLTTTDVIPFVGGGYSFNSINWETYVYDHSGDGYFLTAGAILPLDERWSLNLSFAHHNFSGSRIIFSSSDYENYTTKVNLFAFNVVYHFIGYANMF